MPKRSSSVQKGKPKPIGGGKKSPNSKQDKNFMSELHFNGGGHAPSGKK